MFPLVVLTSFALKIRWDRASTVSTVNPRVLDAEKHSEPIDVRDWRDMPRTHYIPSL